MKKLPLYNRQVNYETLCRCQGTLRISLSRTRVNLMVNSWADMMREFSSHLRTEVQLEQWPDGQYVGVKFTITNSFDLRETNEFEVHYEQVTLEIGVLPDTEKIELGPLAPEAASAKAAALSLSGN